jgi:hypothetical protein
VPGSPRAYRGAPGAPRHPAPTPRQVCAKAGCWMASHPRESTGWNDQAVPGRKSFPDSRHALSRHRLDDKDKFNASRSRNDGVADYVTNPAAGCCGPNFPLQLRRPTFHTPT